MEKKQIAALKKFGKVPLMKLSRRERSQTKCDHRKGRRVGKRGIALLTIKQALGTKTSENKNRQERRQDREKGNSKEARGPFSKGREYNSGRGGKGQINNNTEMSTRKVHHHDK